VVLHQKNLGLIIKELFRFLLATIFCNLVIASRLFIIIINIMPVLAIFKFVN